MKRRILIMNNFPNQFHDALNQAVKPQPNGHAPIDQKIQPFHTK